MPSKKRARKPKKAKEAPKTLAEAKAHRFHEFPLEKKGAKIVPVGRLEHPLDAGKVPRGARIFLHKVQGASTPIYLYNRRYNFGGHGEKAYLVLDFRRSHLDPNNVEHAFLMHDIVVGLGLERFSRSGHLVLKFYNGVWIEKNLHHDMIEKARKTAAEAAEKKKRKK